MEKREFRLIEPEVVKYNLTHLKQLVFEVTDACNLKCKYCAYAGFYQGFDERKGKVLPFHKARLIIDYLHRIWKENYIKGTSFPISISFYGGEPLLNMPFIKEVIAYLESLEFVGKKIFFNMTTNAMLLDKYMDYLVDKKFRLLISLDGDEEGHSYRVDHAGNSSFGRVTRNIKLLQEKYLEYFSTLVQFNSVLHNKNSVEATYRYVKDNFGKSPRISSLNNSGIKDEKKSEFFNTYQNVTESIRHAQNCEALEAEMFIDAPEISSLAKYIFYETGNVFDTYNDLFVNKSLLSLPPTGTCVPFSKKMFITVNGKIIPCERIDHDFAVGFVHDDYVELDLQYATDRHNHFVSKYETQCQHCAQMKSCPQCVYQIDDVRENKTVCRSFYSKKTEKDKNKLHLEYLKKHPEVYDRILKEVSIRG